MEEQRARQEQEARRGQAASGSEAATTRPETIDESKIISIWICDTIMSKVVWYGKYHDIFLKFFARIQVQTLEPLYA